MWNNLGNLTNLLKSAKDMQGKFTKLQEELAARRYEGDAGGGMVRASVDGKGTLVNIRIDPQAAQDVELLEDLVKAAVGAATAKAQAGLKTELAAIAGDLNVPGLMEMLGGA